MALSFHLRYHRPNDASQVFFMGIGDAYLGLVDLLSHHGMNHALISQLEMRILTVQKILRNKIV